MDNTSKAHHLFHAICIVASLSLIARAIYFYALDEDTTSVIFRKLNELEESSYPSISFRFKDPLFKGYWKRNDGGLKKEPPWVRRNAYFKFLQGDFFNPELANVDYDMATRRLEKYLNYITFYFKSNYYVIWKSKWGSLEFIAPQNDKLVPKPATHKL